MAGGHPPRVIAGHGDVREHFQRLEPRVVHIVGVRIYWNASFLGDVEDGLQVQALVFRGRLALGEGTHQVGTHPDRLPQQVG